MPDYLQKQSPYYEIAYDSKGRFYSYWHQIYEIIKLRPNKLLEIGKGNGFVSGYLKEKRIDLKTLDINVKLNPDIVGNVLDIPLVDDAVDVVSCCEVLEHLPYKLFQKP